jgi:hypothetical protein
MSAFAILGLEWIGADRLTFCAMGAKSERALILRTRVLGDMGDTTGDCSPEPSISELSSSAARATAKALMWLHESIASALL